MIQHNKINKKQNQQNNNKLALGYMLVAVILLSTFPLTLAFSNASNAPFIFSGLVNFSSVITGLIFLVLFHYIRRENQNTKETLRIIRSKFFTQDFLWVLASGIGIFLFALSLSLINVAIATIFLGTWPIFMVFTTAWLFKKDERYQKITREKLLLFALSFVGAAFVVASQSENFSTISSDLLNQRAGIGTLLAIFAAIMGGMGTAYSLKLGSEATQELGSEKHDELFFTMVFLVIAWLVGSVLFIILGHISSESFIDIKIYPAIIYGSLGAAGVILSRLANFKTNNLGINAIGYALPVVSLIWLGLASLINVPRFDWLVIGTSVIIIANILLTLKASTPPTYKTLIILLWLLVTAVYLT